MTRGLGRHLSRTKAHRDALLRNMATQLLQHGTIMSTTPKLKETQKYVERIITIAKHGVQNGTPQKSIPELQSRLYLSGDNSNLLKKLFEEIVPRYISRDGGYTRVMKVEPRLSDRAPQGILELVDAPVQSSDGQLLKGNMKLWLLTKNCMQQIEEEGQKLTPNTVKNLKKMTHNKSVDELMTDIGVVRKYLIEAAEPEGEFNEEKHKAFLETVKNEILNFSAPKQKQLGYKFVERPTQQ